MSGLAVKMPADWTSFGASCLAEVLPSPPTRSSAMAHAVLRTAVIDFLVIAEGRVWLALVVVFRACGHAYLG